MSVETSEHTFTASASSGDVSAILVRPERPSALYVLAHGAGAGIRHPFMARIAETLAARGVASFRYQFPYMEQGKKRPDPPRVARATVRRAVAAAAELAPGLPLIAGGKSFGGRMSSQAAAESALESVRGLVFLGFPLHAPGRDGTERAAHLADVKVPMLFLQGTRDSLAKLPLIEEVCGGLGRRATLHVVEGGDHSFGVRKKDGRTADEVMEELGDAIVAWVARAMKR